MVGYLDPWGRLLLQLDHAQMLSQKQSSASAGMFSVKTRCDAILLLLFLLLLIFSFLSQTLLLVYFPSFQDNMPDVLKNRQC